MLKKLLVISLLGAAAASTAQAASPGFYVGAGIGQARYDDTIPTQIRDAYRNDPGYSFVSASMVDDTDQAWKIFGGYRILPWLGVEFSWVDLGEVRSNFVLRSLVPLTNANAVIDGRYKISGPSGTVFGELDFTDNFSGLLRFGLYNAKLDYSEGGLNADNSPHSYSHSDSTTKITYGLGLNVRVNPSWDVRLDWDRYTDVGRRFALRNETNGRFDHIDLISLNLAYRFGQ